MRDDEWFERLAHDAKRLRYQPRDPWSVERLIRGVQAGLDGTEAAPPVYLLLSRWFRPLAAVLALAAILGSGVLMLSLRRDEAVPTISAELLLLQEKLYGAAE